ncbi:jg21947 [Pararge aegeria aegeria]|uniref:Jg21947 protein n=1 Tax=Pararge aegeria aegeria TaxID=348720 RepID=A0A8S4SHZ8_9NEOP|nr:jg21947 [Pararge aegeria aegeria]
MFSRDVVSTNPHWASVVDYGLSPFSLGQYDDDDDDFFGVSQTYRAPYLDIYTNGVKLSIGEGNREHKISDKYR